MYTEPNKTWNNRRGDIVSMFKFCEKKQLLRPGALPYGSLERRKVMPGSRATCTVEELLRLLTCAEYLRDQVCIALQAQTGLRTAEASRFRLCFVHWEECIIQLPGSYLGERVTKTGEARNIPVPPALFKVLWRLKNDNFPETDLIARVRNWSCRLKKISKLAGVKLPHNALRHGYGSHRREIIGLDKTAENMGTSTWYVKNHYSLPQLHRVSESWFKSEAPVLSN
jgi:integrase